MSKKIKAYSVRVKWFTYISDRAMLIESFDGSKDVFPISQFFGNDYDVEKSTALWISAWILEKKSIQFSKKKIAWFNEAGKMLPKYIVNKHVPKRKEAVKTQPDESLVR